MTTISSNSLNTSNSSPEERRDWLELQSEVTLAIMMKLDTLEIQDSVQFVCKLWYNLCKDPSVWRTIHIECPDIGMVIERENRLLSALERSGGGLIDLNIVGIMCDNVISYVASRSSQLKRLRLAHCIIFSDKATTEAIEKLSSLEELELTCCFPRNIQCLLRPSLTTLKLNKMGSKAPWNACDMEAFAIAGSMSELRHLQLIGNDITDIGLKAILDGCPHLKSLDLRACFHLQLAGNLKERLSKEIKNFCNPNDSTEDYEYDVDADEYAAKCYWRRMGN